MPDSSPSPAAPASYGSRDAVPAHASSAVNRPQKRRVRLPHAEADLNFAAPLQHQTRQRSRKIQEIPANADVAQLVEHFTRKEGARGSRPGAGWAHGPPKTAQMQVISMTCHLPTRVQEKPLVDPAAPQVAAPVQPGFEPRTPSPVMQHERCGRPR